MPPPEQHPQLAYAAFASALTDPEHTTPSVVVGPNGKTCVKRYSVYRNNVTVSLIDTLAAIYPAVQRITGVDFFRAMARFHVRATPPTSPLLFEYGRDFPAFIEGYEYAQSMPWLADTARLERAWLDAYHAANAEPLSPAALAAVPSERLADVVFNAHPATRIVRSPLLGGNDLRGQPWQCSRGQDRRLDAGRCPDHAAQTRGRRSIPSAGRRGLPHMPDFKATTRRSGRNSDGGLVLV